jgi:hypothetical protein
MNCATALLLDAAPLAGALFFGIVLEIASAMALERTSTDSFSMR